MKLCQEHESNYTQTNTRFIEVKPNRLTSLQTPIENSFYALFITFKIYKLKNQVLPLSRISFSRENYSENQNKIFPLSLTHCPPPISLSIFTCWVYLFPNMGSHSNTNYTLWAILIIVAHKWFIWTIYYWALEMFIGYELIMCRYRILTNYY